MENSELKEKIRKNIKEEIAVSNIRKEFDMKSKKNKKIIYWITSCAAVVVLGFGIMLGTNIEDSNDKLADLEQDKQNSEESLKIDLQINKIENIGAAMFDADVKEISLDANVKEGINILEKEISIPDDLNNFNRYAIYTRKSKTSEYDILNCYVYSYFNLDSERSIRIAFSDTNKPMRDYLFSEEGAKKSNINGSELTIFQYKDTYFTEFKYENYNFDIETHDITENELVELLQSILTENANKNTPVEDKDVNVNEQPSENINTGYPEYYAGKYVDNNGNNVVLLCEDNEANRKEICSLLGITESKTIFKTAKYSYNYLTDLQSKISKKMIDKEFTFVTSSAVMEDSNNIEVTVTSNNESDLNQIKALDVIGGAINIQYNSNSMATEDLLIE